MLLPLLMQLDMFTPPAPPAITYWDATAIGKSGRDDKKDKKQELEILLLLLG